MEADVYEVDPKDANIVVILSEAFGSKNVLLKVWLEIPASVGMNKAIKYVAEYYPDYIDTNVRIDIYRARRGAVIGG